LEEIHPVDVSQLEGKPILIVDDNETALKIVADIVKRVGMVPVLAGSGKEALKYFRLPIADCRFENPQEQIGDTSRVESSIANRKSQIDVAIIDITLPEMTGYELAEKITELTGGKTKTIAISGNPFLGSSAEAKKAGFDSFIPKPVRPQVLMDLIRTTLGIGKKQPKDIVTRHRVKEIMTHDVRILYAEDNPVNQLLGKKMFKRMGYNKVEIVPDGLEAVKKIKENGPYDIIFMDIQMPNIDGMEATKTIRKWEEEIRSQGDKTRGGESAGEKLETGNWKLETGDPSQQSSIVNSQSSIQKVPIIALTANAMKGDREKYLEAGMDDYVPKPFKREDIQRAIEEWVHKVEPPVEVPREIKILIVEDEEKMRKSIMRVIKRKMPAIRVMPAEDGIDATAKLGSFMPDLIVTDIMMPHMDGIEFIRYVHDTDRYAKTKIIAMTGLHKDDHRVSEVQEAGVEKVMYKPWEDEDLIMTIREALRA
jgi:CheY-like chemotaxis protein